MTWKSTHCTAKTADGRDCPNWAVRHSDPPRCSSHRGGKTPVGAPQANTNAQIHGLYASDPDLPPVEPCTIDNIIQDLYTRQKWFSRWIANRLAIDSDDENIITADELVSLLQVFGQNASRLGRLLRDKRVLTGESLDTLAGVIAQALDELGAEMDVEL